MEIRKAAVQGFCFGVAITVKKAEEAIATRGDVTTLGHVVHNPQMVAQLEEKGLRNAASVDEVEGGTLFVRAHGLPVAVFEKAQEKGLEVIDATSDGYQDSRKPKLKAGCKDRVDDPGSHSKGTLSRAGLVHPEPAAWKLFRVRAEWRRRSVDMVGRRSPRSCARQKYFEVRAHLLHRCASQRAALPRAFVTSMLVVISGKLEHQHRRSLNQRRARLSHRGPRRMIAVVRQRRSGLNVGRVDADGSSIGSRHAWRSSPLYLIWPSVSRSALEADYRISKSKRSRYAFTALRLCIRSVTPRWQLRPGW